MAAAGSLPGGFAARMVSAGKFADLTAFNDQFQFFNAP